MIAGATGQGGAYLGETYSVREFVELAFAQIGHRIEWRGRGVNEEGIDAHGGDVLVAVIRGISGRLRSIGCSAICLKVQQRLGWRHKIEFADLAREMVEGAPALLGTEGRLYNRSG